MFNTPLNCIILQTIFGVEKANDSLKYTTEGNEKCLIRTPLDTK